MLTEEQLRYFNSFGFIVLKGLLTTAEVERLGQEFDARVAETARMVPLGDETRDINGLVPSTPMVAELFEDDRFAGLGEQIFGDLIPSGAIVHYYVGDSVWHYDAGGYESFGLKLAVYLDPVRGDSGALRVIPGSHLRPYHDMVADFDPVGPRFSRAAATSEETRRAIEGIGDIPSVVCDSDPGDVVAFDLRTYHASRGGTVGRRMCSFTYYNYPNEPAEIELIIHHARDHMSRRDNTGDPWNPPSLAEEWVAAAPEHPRRAAWLDYLKRFSSMELEQRGVRAVVENGKLLIEEMA
jgi:hypothetical protein